MSSKLIIDIGDVYKHNPPKNLQWTSKHSFVQQLLAYQETIEDEIYEIYHCHLRCCLVTGGVSGDGIRGHILDSWYMYHPEVVSESFFLKVTES